MDQVESQIAAYEDQMAYEAHRSGECFPYCPYCEEEQHDREDAEAFFRRQLREGGAIER